MSHSQAPKELFTKKRSRLGSDVDEANLPGNSRVKLGGQGEKVVEIRAKLNDQKMSYAVLEAKNERLVQACPCICVCTRDKKIGGNSLAIRVSPLVRWRVRLGRGMQ
jgi:hypothetical protein